MAELAAIGLASNILQFLELGIKLYSKGRAKYQSVSGISEEDEELITDTQRVRSLARLIHEGNSIPDKQLIEVHLYEIARSCDVVATALIDTLDELGVGTGRNRRWESFRKALRQEFKKTEIEKREGRLRNLRENLILHLVTTSSNRQSVTLTVVQNLKSQNEKLEAKTMTKLESIQSLLQNTQASDANRSVEIISHLDQLAAEVRSVQRQQKILSSLLFSKIKQRHIAIQEHHKATFHWIFTANKTRFCEWLEHGDGFFWISGKAGSGKSTLMKFLATHNDTQAKLQTWGGPRRVVMASHFFWSAGNAMQKSLTGLLQTLLYQVLKECPELIEVVCDSRWKTFESTHSDPWDDAELLSAFNELSHQNLSSLKFCFFIDGLDEYTAGAKRYHGTFSELIEVLKAISSSDSIKICISSRPWNAFNDSFGQGNWNLQLESVTKEDIRRYVQDELTSDPHFQHLALRDSRCTQIPDTIVTRAQGVFLWVYLVVLSLKRGLSDEDNYSDLQQRLNQLPDDLEEYFRHMLQSIETVYWDQTTRIFRVAIEAEQSLPLLGFEFLEQEMVDPGYAIRMETRPLSAKAIAIIWQRLKKRLNARCRDLLYVHDEAGEVGLLSFQVDFLHRTVRDFFLDTNVIDEIFRQRPTRQFNPHLSLCKMMLALSKTLDVNNTHSEVFNHIFILADSLMYYAWQIEKNCLQSSQDGENQQDQSRPTEAFNILDELDRSNSELLKQFGFHWTNLKDSPKGMFQEYGKKTFLASAIQSRLFMYVEERLRQNLTQLRQKRGRPLLDYALRPTMVTPLRVLSLEEGPELRIVKLLLDFKADPNHSVYVYDGKTAWELFLEACFQHAGSGLDIDNNIEDIGATIQLMISHGAKTPCSLKLDDGTVVDITDIVDRLGLSTYQTGQIKQLIEKNGSKQSVLSWITSWVS
ncbi:hypothetical protein BGZ61DRAFT_533946 [Ilyonectria robusta]|uniref:uncharacterized protein n=1 Tax=Ilyonectria robusta TaxID=1079257 RepID=UPI001E8DBE0A|nr:uncharacterized protein BGZ61DRAFT_533946 [Ilyonectria robusta]KAH8686404.1 hypothetical protein BGZ61DRAFT_533946 [Ilyonectria robusta]